MDFTLSNDNFSATINSKGAELNSIKDLATQTEYIWNGNPKFWGKHSPVLFPIVGALKNDCYQFEGKTYSLSRHGFARDFEFEMIEKTANSITFSLNENEFTLSKYPFQFELQIKYQLLGSKLIICYLVNNNSNSKMPFCIGAHPAFSLPKSFERYSLEFEKDEALLTHELENNVFSGVTRNIPLINSKLPLQYSLFEKDALVFKSIQSKSITILDDENPLLKVNYSDFSSLGIWTVANAPFICIEPWIGFADLATSNGNLFEKENGVVLEPKTEFTASFSIEIL